jgi:hypothetical protein
MIVLNCIRIYLVIFRMCSDKADPHHLIFVIYLYNQSISISFDVKHYSVVDEAKDKHMDLASSISNHLIEDLVNI